MIKRLISLLLPLFSGAFLLGATALIIVIMNGYSIDISKQTIIETGVLNIETNPSDADITVNNQYYGKTNKAIPNLPVNTYSISVSKQGYYPYKRAVDIIHGLASPVIVPLLRQNDPKQVMTIPKDSLVDTNTTGYYILAQNIVATPTPTVTGKKTSQSKENVLTYTLTHAYIAKPLFDDPKPATDETMQLSVFSSTPITSFSLSPTGKLILVTLTDKSGVQSISLVPFKKGTTVNVNLADVRVLTFYKKADKKTIMSWSDDGDYLLIDTPTQVISYNVKTATRIILLEKQELEVQTDVVVWNKDPSGIVLVKKIQGTDAKTYELDEFSYNGNPLATQAPVITLPDVPERIWSFTQNQRPIYVISTKTGTFAIGKLYDSRIGEYELSLSNTDIKGSSITHYSNDFSQILLTTTSSSDALLVPTKFEFTLLSSDKTVISFFNYNRRAADHLTKLGLLSLPTTNTPITLLTKDETTYYAFYAVNQELHATDTLGENDYTLQSGMATPVFGQNDTAFLYTNTEGNLFFKLLR